MKRKPVFTSLGSVSVATGDNLIGELACALRNRLRTYRVNREDRKRFVALLSAIDYEPDAPHTAEANQLTIAALIEALETFAPPHAWFGERDGDWGFWPITDDNLPQFDGSENFSSMYWGAEAYLVTDHDNISCGRFDKRGRWHEYWSVV